MYSVIVYAVRQCNKIASPSRALKARVPCKRREEGKNVFYFPLAFFLLPSSSLPFPFYAIFSRLFGAGHSRHRKLKIIHLVETKLSKPRKTSDIHFYLVFPEEFDGQ